MGAKHTPTGCAISPQELEGLLTVLKLIGTIATLVSSFLSLSVCLFVSLTFISLHGLQIHDKIQRYFIYLYIIFISTCIYLSIYTGWECSCGYVWEPVLVTSSFTIWSHRMPDTSATEIWNFYNPICICSFSRNSSFNVAYSRIIPGQVTCHVTIVFSLSWSCDYLVILCI